MIRSVVLIAKSGMDGWWQGTALGRSDVQVLSAQSYAEGYRLVVSGQRDLVIAEDWPGADGFLPFLHELSASLDEQAFKVILLTSRLLPADVARPVFDILHPPCTREALNTSVVQALELVPRASQRHLVRIHVGVENQIEEAFASGVTLQINAGGMLMESTEHLPAERPFYFTFHGIKELEGFAIPGRVLRREATPQLTRVFRYVVAFDPEATEGKDRLVRYLDNNNAP